MSCFVLNRSIVFAQTLPFICNDYLYKSISQQHCYKEQKNQSLLHSYHINRNMKSEEPMSYKHLEICVFNVILFNLFVCREYFPSKWHWPRSRTRSELSDGRMKSGIDSWNRWRWTRSRSRRCGRFLVRLVVAQSRGRRRRLGRLSGRSSVLVAVAWRAVVAVFRLLFLKQPLLL